jgi:hypothetical protein
MQRLQQFYSRKGLIWIWGAMGDILLVIGIVTAGINTTISGFTPVVWFLLAFACYVGMFFVIALRVLNHLEATQLKSA